MMVVHVWEIPNREIDRGLNACETTVYVDKLIHGMEQSNLRAVSRESVNEVLQIEQIAEWSRFVSVEGFDVVFVANGDSALR
jgi:hypothetical protein